MNEIHQSIFELLHPQVTQGGVGITDEKPVYPPTFVWGYNKTFTAYFIPIFPHTLLKAEN